MHRRLRPFSAAALIAVLLVCGPIAHRLLAQSFGDQLQSVETERFLRDGKIMKLGDTLGGVTRSRQATLELNGQTRFAVWKTIDQKKTGVTSLGTAGYEINFQDTWKNEVPAYELDKLLGLGMVPASVSRKYRNVEGALTAWVDLGMSEAERLKKQLVPPDPAAWSQNMSKVQLFDNLIYNIDRHANNIYITTDWHIILIDHSRSFRSFTELRTESDLRRFSRSILAAMEKLDRPTLDEKMSRYLDGGQIDALLARRDAIVARARRLVQEQGEAAVLFP
jgi:hypothetical protein